MGSYLFSVSGEITRQGLDHSWPDRGYFITASTTVTIKTAFLLSPDDRNFFKILSSRSMDERLIDSSHYLLHVVSKRYAIRGIF